MQPTTNLISAEHEGSVTRVNSGMIVIRNSQWSLDFLDSWWNYADRRLYSDQEQFDLLYSALLNHTTSFSSKGNKGKELLVQKLVYRKMDHSLDRIVIMPV
mgnify:FL=1